MAAGAAGDASAADGVAGESSMLPCEEVGLSHIFSDGRYGMHCFLGWGEKLPADEGEKGLNILPKCVNRNVFHSNANKMKNGHYDDN